MNAIERRTFLSRRGFTLVELLVVITIIGMLMALILPAVHGTVGRARQMQCANNMRQVALAVQSHTIRRGHYPGYQEDLAGRTVPWPVLLLGELDRHDLYDDWSDVQMAAEDLPRSELEVLMCPSDPPLSRGEPSISTVGNAGTPDADKRENGVMLDGTGVTATDIRDGAANTLLLSENIQATRWDTAGKLATVFLWHPTTSPRTEQLINRGRQLPLSADTARPSSRHIGGVNVSFCDTHTVFLNESIDYKIYMQLMTPRGKQSDMPAEWRDYRLNTADFQ